MFVQGTHGEKYSDFASENTWSMPLKMITEPGTRNDEYIDFILENLEKLVFCKM